MGNPSKMLYYNQSLDTEMAAIYLGVSKQTMINWRFQKKGPIYYKLGTGPRGRVVYRMNDLDDYLISNRIDPKGV